MQDNDFLFSFFFFFNLKVDPANQQDVANILASATSETGIVNNLFVGADIKIAPVAKVLGKFLNEEADSAPSDQEIIATTSNLFVYKVFFKNLTFL